MERALVEVTVCVGGFPVNVVVRGAVRISGDANMKERDPAIFFYFHCKLNAGVFSPLCGMDTWQRCTSGLPTTPLS